jgi:hypothetical protein
MTILFRENIGKLRQPFLCESENAGYSCLQRKRTCAPAVAHIRHFPKNLRLGCPVIAGPGRQCPVFRLGPNDLAFTCIRRVLHDRECINIQACVYKLSPVFCKFGVGYYDRSSAVNIRLLHLNLLHARRG